MEKVALVTGANRGIGRETAWRLAEEGFTVLLSARDEEKARAAARELKVGALRIEPLTLDVDDAESVAAAAEAVKSRHGRLDVLVNNAAVLLDKDDWNGGLSSLDEDTLRKTLETNLIGAFRVCLAFLPLMKKSGPGRVVNVSSGAGQLDGMGVGAPAYKMSKAALNALTKILAAECQKDGILVNAVCPGWVRTEMGGDEAPRTVQEGAKGILWAATLPEKGPTGGFFRDRKPIPW